MTCFILYSVQNDASGGGLFSAVTGLRRFGDFGKSATTNGHSSSASGNTLRKRTFSEVGKLSSTVAAQQFVFTSGMDEGSQFSRPGDSSTGFGASRTASLNPGSARPRVLGAAASSSGAGGSGGGSGGIPGGSLFAQLGAKRGGGLKGAK